MRDDYSQFEEKGIQPFGVNPASVESHLKYATKKNYQFPLLSDQEREVAAAYGVLKTDRKGIQRAVVLIGRDGKVVYSVYGLPSDAEILAAV